MRNTPSIRESRKPQARVAIVIVLAASLAAGLATCQSYQATRSGNYEGGAGGSGGPGGPGGGQGNPPGPPPGAQGSSEVDRGLQQGGPGLPAEGGGLVAKKGGRIVVDIEAQSVSCDFSADRSSSLSIVLRGGATLTGSVNADGTAKYASLEVDAESVWIVTADSRLSSLSARIGRDGASIANIRGGGHSVRYDPAANPGLGGKAYALAGGGSLIPDR